MGESIELNNVFIYSKNKIIFEKAFYYNNFELNDLPDWINFSGSNGIITMDVILLIRAFIFTLKIR